MYSSENCVTGSRRSVTCTHPVYILHLRCRFARHLLYNRMASFIERLAPSIAPQETNERAEAVPIVFAPIPEALEAFKRGEPLIVMDDESRENEGDLISAAELTTPELMAFFVNETTGIICAPMLKDRAYELELPLMVVDSTDPNKTAYTITCDAYGTSTGVGASDRTLTVKTLADATKKAGTIRRPGHILPLIARTNGVLERRGHTEAAVDLCRLAGVSPVGVIGELVNKDGSMQRLDDCARFAAKYGLKLITIEALAKYRESIGDVYAVSEASMVKLESQAEITLNVDGEELEGWSVSTWYSQYDHQTHVVCELGDLTREPYSPVLARVHSECFTGDVLGSRRCDCNEQLHRSLREVHKVGRGIVIYNKGHEGRGIGLSKKLKAYDLQQKQGLDTYEANKVLGLPLDSRVYDSARAIFKARGIEKLELLTNNSDKLGAFADMVVRTRSLDGTPNRHNTKYLAVKRARKGIHKHASTENGDANGSDAPGAREGNGYESVSESEASSVVSYDANDYYQNGMSIKSMPKSFVVEESVARKLRIAVVRTLWNENAVAKVFDNVLAELKKAGVAEENIVAESVPGSQEVTYAANLVAPLVDAIIVIGVLVKGATDHYDRISDSVIQGTTHVQTLKNVPIINGVLNCRTEQQVVERIDDGDLAKVYARDAILMGALKLKYAKVYNERSASL